MDADKEEQSVAAVIERLSEQFPQVDRSNLETLVQQMHAQFSGASIRDYVPVLVEHSAKDRLRQRLLGNPAA